MRTWRRSCTRPSPPHLHACARASAQTCTRVGCCARGAHAARQACRVRCAPAAVRKRAAAAAPAARAQAQLRHARCTRLLPAGEQKLAAAAAHGALSHLLSGVDAAALLADAGDGARTQTVSWRAGGRLQPCMHTMQHTQECIRAGARGCASSTRLAVRAAAQRSRGDCHCRPCDCFTKAQSQHCADVSATLALHHHHALHAHCGSRRRCSSTVSCQARARNPCQRAWPPCCPARLAAA